MKDFAGTRAAHGRQLPDELNAAAAAAGRLAAGGYTVVYDGVLGAWAVDRFLAAAGLEQLHYAVLLPAEATCVDRVTSRVGHGFTDLDATRHMYNQFADAVVDGRYVIRGSRPAAEIAESIGQLASSSAIEWTLSANPTRERRA